VAKEKERKEERKNERCEREREIWIRGKERENGEKK
jgi:hypothetical protein